MLKDTIRHYLQSDQGKRNSTLLLFILMGWVCLLLSINKPLGDYANYYYGSKFVLQKFSTQEIYEPIAFNQLIRAQQKADVFANYAPVPPFSLFFYIPFTLISASLSKFLFGLLGLCLCSISLYRLLKMYPISSYMVLLLPLVFLFPLKSNLYLGQSYLYILCFLIEGFLFTQQKKGELPAALFFSLAIALKIFPAIILLYLFYTDKKRIMVYTIAFTTLWFVLSIPLIGTEQLFSYLTESLPRLFSGEINDPYASSYQSVTVLLKKIFLPDAILNPNAWFDAPLIFVLLNTLFPALVLSFSINVCRSAAFSSLFKWSFTLFSGLLISGYGTSYTLLLLMFLFIPLMSNDTQKRTTRYFYGTLLLFITVIPIHLFFGQIILLQFIRLYGMLLLFVVLLYFYRIHFSIITCSVSLCILSIPVLMRSLEKEDNSTYYPTHIPALLLYDYHPCAQGICINYYDEQGTHEWDYETKDRIQTDKNLEVRDGHIYYKGQILTFGNNNNKSPLLLNTNEVIYLSDKNRGIGFYALRRIKLPQ